MSVSLFWPLVFFLLVILGHRLLFFFRSPPLPACCALSPFFSMLSREQGEIPRRRWWHLLSQPVKTRPDGLRWWEINSCYISLPPHCQLNICRRVLCTFGSSCNRSLNLILAFLDLFPRHEHPTQPLKPREWCPYFDVFLSAAYVGARSSSGISTHFFKTIDLYCFCYCTTSPLTGFWLESILRPWTVCTSSIWMFVWWKL